MNKLLVSMMTIVLSIVFVSSASAGIRDPRINAHQARQHERIAQGKRSGELTHAESQDLHGDERGIRQEERADKSDGQFTKAERQDVRQDQAAVSKEIYQDKHNDVVRP